MMKFPSDSQSDQTRKYEAFKALHAQDHAFIIANAWDAGSACILSSIGFEALATSSAGYAFCAGKRDSFASLTQAEILSNAKAIVEATSLPVSADLEDGFGKEPGACVNTIENAIAMGLVGGSIEDATGDPDDPIYDFDLSVERITAAAEAKSGKPFLLTARAENWVWGRDDLPGTIKRLQAFCDAGADVLYAPGLPDIDAIRTVCREVPKPVNVVMGSKEQLYSVEELAAAGVCRISVGGSFVRAAFGALWRAAEEVKTRGTFNYAADTLSGDVLAKLMSQEKRSSRQ